MALTTFQKIILSVFIWFGAAILWLWFVAATSCPTFEVSDLETLVHQAVKDFPGLPGDDTQQYLDATRYYESEITDGKNGRIANADLIEAYRVECLLAFIAQRFREKYPKDAVKDSKWCINEVGSVYARQLILIANPREYVCLWGSVLEQEGFGGAYGGNLDEGDVMITSQMESSDPESKRAAPRTYLFGDTSLLKPYRRRHYHLGKNCYMMSFCVHAKSNLIFAFFPGIILPYLFENHDTISFKIQMGDALKGFRMWLSHQMERKEVVAALILLFILKIIVILQIVKQK